MKYIFVGVGDYGTTNTPGSALKTMALGSCVGIVFLCPVTKAVGMVHIALPDSTINPELAKKKPGYFADTGIPKLIEEMKKYQCYFKNNLIVKIAGGASILDSKQIFNVGSRNIKAVKEILAGYGMNIKSEDVGKNLSRTMTVEVDTGRVYLSSPEYGVWDL
ncbi:chemotaxis protein CheD [bacterium]|nr:chemotaxis protein CheD [bacterium]